MLVRIEDIKVKKRIRKEMGDISALADSMKRFGQISPILINQKNFLIAGERRLEAARSLGWNSINAAIAEIPDDLTILEYEIEENLQRMGFTKEEFEEAHRKLDRLRNPSLFRRMLAAIKRFFKRLFKTGE